MEGLKDLSFKNANRYYNLKFNHLRIMQIKGESGVGKSLFCSDLSVKKSIDADFSNILIFDYKNKDMLPFIKDFSSYDYVVLDNADLYMTERLGRVIEKDLLAVDSKTHWIIIGRDYYPCVLSLGSVGVLVREEKDGNYYYSVDYSLVN